MLTCGWVLRRLTIITPLGLLLHVHLDMCRKDEKKRFFTLKTFWTRLASVIVFSCWVVVGFFFCVVSVCIRWLAIARACDLWLWLHFIIWGGGGSCGPTWVLLLMECVGPGPWPEAVNGSQSLSRSYWKHWHQSDSNLRLLTKLWDARARVIGSLLLNSPK